MSQLSEYQRLRAGRTIAAELAQWGGDLNVLRSAAAYMKADPDADLFDWLERLVRLGDFFSSSNNTELYRQQLKVACERTRDQFEITTGEDWVWVLGWASRFMLYYRESPRAAEAVSAVKPFQPMAIEPFRRTVLHQAGDETEGPGPEEAPSEEAEDLFAQFTKHWNEKGKK